jgi:hypothetical protein
VVTVKSHSRQRKRPWAAPARQRQSSFLSRLCRFAREVDRTLDQRKITGAYPDFWIRITSRAPAPSLGSPVHCQCRSPSAPASAAHRGYASGSSSPPTSTCRSRSTAAASWSCAQRLILILPTMVRTVRRLRFVVSSTIQRSDLPALCSLVTAAICPSLAANGRPTCCTLISGMSLL